MSQVAKSFYVTGGTLRSDAPSYVGRQADKDLYQGIKQGEYCYVLTARQMGKSSLMVRAAHQLRRDGVAVAVLDLTSVGQNLSTEQWYLGLLDHIGQQLQLEDELEEFWEEHAALGPLQRWMQALREVVLEQRPGQVVILIDEIDAVRSLPFTTDEFFAAIRECYNRRTSDPAMGRLIFCLFGVATPSDLIRDTRTTPFNVGRRIELADFREAEAQPLAQGLNRDPATATVLLGRIYYWTAGHPYLMQRMCRVVAEDLRIKSPRDVDRLCGELFLSPRARERDDNLLFVRERILRSEVDRSALLDLFDRVRRGKHVPDDETDPLISVLRLSGITRVEHGALRLRNPIYADVFDGKWIEANLPDAEKRRQRRAYRRGLLRASIAAGVLMLILGGLIWYGWDRQVKSLEAEARLESERLVQVELKGTISKLKDAIDAGERLAKERDEAMKIAEEEKRLSLQRRAFQFAADRGWEQHDKHESPKSLPWFLDAMHQEKGDPKRLALHELRLGGLLTTFPRLAAVFHHDGEALDADIGPDGAQIVTAHSDNVVEWRDVASGATRATYATASSLASIRFVDHGRHVLARTKSGSALLLSSKGKRVAAVGPDAAGDKTPVTVLAAGASGDKVWVAIQDPRLTKAEPSVRDVGNVHIVDLLNGNKPVVPMLEHKLNTKPQTALDVRSAVFSPDLRWLATTAEDNVVRVWDLTRPGAAAQEIKARAAPELVFEAPSILLVGARMDQGAAATPLTHLTLYDVTAKQVLVDKHFSLQVLGVSPDNRWLLTNGLDLKSHLWSLTGKEVDPAKTLAKGLLAAPWTPSMRQLDYDGLLTTVSFSPDGRLVAGIHKQTKAVRVWDTSTGKATQPWVHDNVKRVLFSRNGRFLMTVSSEGGVRLWDQLRESWGMPPPQLSELRGGCCASDGSAIALIGSDHTIWLCAKASLPLTWTPIQAGGWTEKAWFSPDAQRLVTLDADKKLHAWDTRSGKKVGQTTDARGLAWLMFRPQSRAMLLADASDTLRLLDCDSGQELRTFRHERDIIEAVFSADGATLAVRGRDGTALWNADTGAKLGDVPLPGPSAAMDLSADGAYLAVAGAGGPARLIRVATGHTVHTLTQQNETRGVCFAAKGKFAATWAKDGAIFLWDVATGEKQKPPILHDGVVARVRFCHGDDLLLVVGRNNTVSLWERATGQRVVAPFMPHWPPGESVQDAVLCETTGCVVLLGKRHLAVCRIAPDAAARACLTKLCHVISAQDVDLDTVRVQALDAKHLAKAWEECRKRLPAVTLAQHNGTDWHVQALADAEQAGDSLAALWHLDKLAASQPLPLWEARRARVLRSLGKFAEAKKTLNAAAKGLPQEVLAWEKTKDVLDEAAYQVKQILGDAPAGAGVNQVYRFKLLGKERQIYSFAGLANSEFKFTVDPDRKEQSNTFDVAVMDNANKDFIYRAGLFGTSTVTWTAPVDGAFKVEVYNFTSQPNEYTLTIAEAGRKEKYEGLSWRIELVKARDRLEESQLALSALPPVFHSHYATLTLPYMQLGKTVLQDGRFVQADEDFGNALTCWKKGGMSSVTADLKRFSADCEQLANHFKLNAAEDRTRVAYMRALMLEGWTGAADPSEKELERYWRLYYELGRAHESVLDVKAARPALEKAVAGLKQWLKATPTRRVEAIAHLANAHYHLGDVERYKEDFERAHQEYAVPMALIDDWLKDEPNHNTGLEHRSFIHRQLGRTALGMGDLAKAKDHLDKALAGYQELHKKKAFDTSLREWTNAILDICDLDMRITGLKKMPPQFAQVEAAVKQSLADKKWREAADLFEDLGLFFELRQMPDKSLEYWKKSLENHRADLEQYKDLTARRSVAYAALMLGDMAARVGETTLALAMGKEGLERYEALLAEAPANVIFSENRAFACSFQGDAHLRLGDHAQARTWYARAASYYDDLLELETASGMLRNRKAVLLQKLGAAWLQAGDAAQAREHLESALKLHPDQPEHAVLLRDRLQTHVHLAEACKRLEKYDDARSAGLEALKLLDDRAAGMLTKTPTEILRIQVWNQLGECALFAGEPAQAADWFTKALETTTRLDAGHKLPTSGLAYRDMLGRIRPQLTVQQQKLWLEAAQNLPAALDDPALIAKAAAPLAAELHRWRAVVMARHGKTGAVISAADALGKPSQNHLGAARVYAAAVLALAKGKPLAQLPAKDKQAVDDLIRRGVDRLSQAASLINVDWLRIMADADLDPLRQSADYRKLLERKKQA